MSIRAAVIGAKGRMGSHAVEAINEAEGIDLVATLGSSDSLETLLDADIDVAVELTVPKSTEDNVRFLVEHDIDTRSEERRVGKECWSRRVQKPTRRKHRT